MNDIPTMFLQSGTDSDSIIIEEKTIKPKKKIKSKRLFNDFPKHQPSNNVLLMDNKYIKRFCMLLAYC